MYVDLEQKFGFTRGFRCHFVRCSPRHVMCYICQYCSVHTSIRKTLSVKIGSIIQNCKNCADSQGLTVLDYTLKILTCNYAKFYSMYSNNCETYNVLKFYSIYVFLGTSKLTDPATITRVSSAIHHVVTTGTAMYVMLIAPKVQLQAPAKAPPNIKR